jgi:hypothetical protein
LPVEDRVRGVIRQLTARPTRDPVTQRFIAGGLGGAVKTLATSALLLQELLPVKQDLVQRVLADRGDDCSEIVAGLAEAYAESRLLRSSMFVRLIEQGGPVTGKGKKRALFDAYLGALDRETRLAGQLGLERRARRVSVEDYVATASQAADGGGAG